MYHCPECATVLERAGAAPHGAQAEGVLHLKTLHYDCPGCGQQYLHWQREFANQEPVEQWFHLDASGKTLLMHNAPDY